MSWGWHYFWRQLYNPFRKLFGLSPGINGKVTVVVGSSLCWSLLLMGGDVIFWWYLSIFSETSNQEIYFFFTLDWLVDGVCSVKKIGENAFKYFWIVPWMRFQLDVGDGVLFGRLMSRTLFQRFWYLSHGLTLDKSKYHKYNINCVNDHETSFFIIHSSTFI